MAYDHNEKAYLGYKKTEAWQDVLFDPLTLTLASIRNVVAYLLICSALPHSLHASSSARVCLITADPQRTVKDLVTDPSFPPILAQRISRVIGLSKIKSRYKSYESRRQLFSEHDVFLADDRIITFLPTVLGKIFYRGGSKRPVPVNLTVGAPKDASEKKDKSIPKNPLPPRKTGPREGKLAGGPVQVAREIEKALTSALVHISPSTTTSVKVGRGRWLPEKIAANVEVVVRGMIEKYVPKGWRNVRSIHIKGNETAALPIWLASELWEDEADVLDKVKEKETVQAVKKKKNTKRKERKEKSEKKQQQQQLGKRKAIEDGNVATIDNGKDRSKKQRKGRESDGMVALSAEGKEHLQNPKDKVTA